MSPLVLTTAPSSPAQHPPAQPSAPAAPSAQVVKPTAAAAASPVTLSPESQRELQLVWSRVRGAAWRSLVLVPAQPGLPVSALGAGLLQVSRAFGAAEPLQLVDARGLPFEDATGASARLAAQVAAGERVLLVLDSPLENVAALTLAHAADAALLCAGPGSSLDAARQTLALCGRERFLGSVLIPRDA